ncbi:ABC transporter ATP-binding protein [Rhizobium lentis]|uniref:ABC transporter ATP-binding protein n=1 Tax=Rhizobium lentis TaxID=1138194 RepID=UPI001C83A278|nr:ABC transporter ATP-binding protein [Rhizobium lentis]MBX4955888.1 ABC transporter ATP-binding protein [Rhizobium lentis]MBX4974456.1 ABC transporter ATP-binding protein [Rhizobium lentis]MBX4985166.1 ABC transporter ATP-binding protein [Rhizobium lentis]MBX5003611.1 ABC transporter ATP-binding protein [Rhizobium lentis]MBX5030067.1 ABC transporter ATP-binding protein [Rhizobium lentis]
MTQPLLSVRNLTIDYIGEEKDFRAVDDVSFDVAPGEVFGLAGESGCGKSTIAFAISRLHKPPALIRRDSRILLDGRDVLGLDRQALAAFRWREVAMVFQSAMNSLNPVLRIERQFYDVLRAHKNVSRAEARERTAEMLRLVDIAPDRMRDYPHQFSGGMRQRIVIAICMALDPKLVVMDEPTTALDVVVQREILQRINELRRSFGFSVMFITHDLGLMVQFCDRIGIMLAGKLVEQNGAEAIYRTPKHAYTKKLWASFPSLHGGVLL